MNKKNVIWIDFDNSPHVPFFKPIIRELWKMDYPLLLTARQCFQVSGLVQLHNLNAAVIGKHYGKNKILKAIGTLIRSTQLYSIISRMKPTIAMSHGSRSQLILAKTLGIRSIEFDDYEFAQELPYIRPDWVFRPEVLPNSHPHIPKNHVIKYPGIKEDIYVPDFKPDPSILRTLGLGEEIIVTIRPPATEAHYYKVESGHLFQSVMAFLTQEPDTRLVLLPRSKKQETQLKSEWNREIDRGKVIIPEKVVDGLNLIFHSDLVISGGGTMNREAAALGVPVYTIFRGRIGAVDRYLSKAGRLTIIENVTDIRSKIIISRRDKTFIEEVTNGCVLNSVLAALIEIIDLQ